MLDLFLPFVLWEISYQSRADIGSMSAALNAILRQLTVSEQTFIPVFIKICSSGEALDLDERMMFLDRFGDILLTWTHPEYLS